MEVDLTNVFHFLLQKTNAKLQMIQMFQKFPFKLKYIE